MPAPARPRPPARPAAAVARRTVRATVAAPTVATGRPWLHDGLPHVELRTRITAALVIACTGSARVACTRRRVVPVAPALAPARSHSATPTATRRFGTVRRWRKRLPLAAIRSATGGRRWLRTVRERCWPRRAATISILI